MKRRLRIRELCEPCPTAPPHANSLEDDSWHSSLCRYLVLEGAEETLFPRNYICLLLAVWSIPEDRCKGLAFFHLTSNSLMVREWLDKGKEKENPESSKTEGTH